MRRKPTLAQSSVSNPGARGRRRTSLAHVPGTTTLWQHTSTQPTMFTSSDTFIPGIGTLWLPMKQLSAMSVVGQAVSHWTLDATEEDFPKAPVFDAVTGFGGNGYYVDSSNDTSVRLHIPGKTGGGCVTDGPFRNYTVNMGPNNSTAYNPRCLKRDFSPSFASQKLNMTMVDKVLAGKTFQEFDVAVQGWVSIDGLTYHGGGHLGVGGDLGDIGDLYNSPSDPLFFLHHANMDRVWATWESQDIKRRVKDISGPDTQFAYPFDFYGDVAYQNITLDYQMHFGALTNSSWVRVGDVMDVQGGVLCYAYDELY
ncbi:tyrosinase central domain protein [Diplodia corticola]|uniref:Tyrosinase central domain protein n=1 Tax=Diplodia corticola TaxID=236234 RepID=A0A1J9RTH1_9PEZI|nr:tyrosinase central domain protein [Diplodia corticola]OJD30821.1 tyrosinase central domain protein [Diplodia corticola]